MSDDLDLDADFGADDDNTETPAQLYQTSVEWFTEWMTPAYIRSVISGGQRTWCALWWKHPEATSRIESLWRAWETARVAGGASMSEWWLLHADPHMAALLDPDGPFAGCKKGQHHRTPIDPLETAPGATDYAE